MAVPAVSIRRSLALSLLQRQLALAIHFGATLVLSRLLTPHEIGVFSLCAVVAGFAHSLRDFGTGEYLVQERELTRARIRSAFTVTLAAAWLLAAILYLLAGPLAVFYREPQIAPALAWLSLNFILLPLGTPAFALLTREMQFGRILVLQTVAATVQSGVAIGFAWQGAGVMSLVWGSIAGTLVSVALAAWYRPRDTWVLPGTDSLREIGRFGAAACAASLLGDATRHGHEFILGRSLGFAALGLYNRAGGLVENFHSAVTSAIARVALPAFSRGAADQASLCAAYLQGIRYFTLFAWPLFAFFLVTAEPLILLLFGDQWGGAVTPLRLLALAAIVGAIHAFSAQALVAAGKVRLRLRLEAIALPVQLGMIGIGSVWGLPGAASGALAAAVAMLAVRQRVMGASLSLAPNALTAACGPALRATLASLPGPLMLLAALPGASPFLLVPLCALASAAGWLAVAWPQLR